MTNATATVEKPLRKDYTSHTEAWWRQIVQEAATSSVHGTALKNGVKPSQLFAYRKRFKKTTLDQTM